MKKILALITLVTTISNLLAEELPPYDYEVEKKILVFCNIPPPHINLTMNIKELAIKYQIPSEQMIKALESIIREGLADANAKHNEYWDTTARAIGMLGVFHDDNTFTLLKDCTLSRSERVRQDAVLTYLGIEGVNAIPFLRETINDGRIFRRQFFYTALWRFIGQLKATDKASAELFYPFILDMLQTEIETLNAPIPSISKLMIIPDQTGTWNATVFYNAYFLPDLTGYIDGYQNSIQRKRFVQHFFDYPIESAPGFIRDAFYGAKDECDKIPADKLIDLGERFALAPIMQDILSNEPSLQTRMTAYLMNRFYSSWEDTPTFTRSFSKRYNRLVLEPKFIIINAANE